MKKIISQSAISKANAKEQALIAELAELKAENAELKKTGVYFKVSQKGAVSVYGLGGRFPITLYRGQWETLIPLMPELAKFIEANVGELKTFN